MYEATHAACTGRRDEHPSFEVGCNLGPSLWQATNERMAASSAPLCATGGGQRVVVPPVDASESPTIAGTASPEHHGAFDQSLTNSVIVDLLAEAATEAETSANDDPATAHDPAQAPLDAPDSPPVAALLRHPGPPYAPVLGKARAVRREKPSRASSAPKERPVRRSQPRQPRRPMRQHPIVHPPEPEVLDMAAHGAPPAGPLFVLLSQRALPVSPAA